MSGLPRIDASMRADWPLHPDETLLWVGAARPLPLERVVRLLPFLGVFVVGMVILSQSTQSLPIWLVFALLLASIGQRLYRDSARNGARYLLTDRAAYIRNGVQRGVAAYPITKDLRLALGHRAVSFSSYLDTSRDQFREVPIGFFEISDAPGVYEMIRALQKAKP